MHENLVFGIFIYENYEKEFDIEFSKWGIPQNSYLNFTLKEYRKYPKQSKNFYGNLQGNFTTHKFVWLKNVIHFVSYHGYNKKLPDANYLIVEAKFEVEFIPTDKTRLHFNFWRFNQSLDIPTESDIIITRLLIDPFS